MSRNIVLSRRESPFNGWVAIDEFEDLLGRLGNFQIAVPRVRHPLPWPVNRIRNKAIGVFTELDSSDERGELLVVVAHTPGDLQMLASVPNARRRFRHIAGYVIDSYFTQDFGPYVIGYDHVFTTTQEAADLVVNRFGLSSSVLSQGFDCLNWACTDADRSIDFIGFGRQPPSYHTAFQDTFHTSKSRFLYLHSPIGTLSGEAIWRERPMLLKLLQRAKISLAFHMLVEPVLNRPRSAEFVTSRWFESLACGCVVMGKRPRGAMAAELFGWPDALLELPDEADKAVAMIQDVSQDSRFIDATRLRNVAQMCKQHDWRYRIRDIFQHFQLSLPELLVQELAMLKDRTLSLGS